MNSGEQASKRTEALFWRTRTLASEVIRNMGGCLLGQDMTRCKRSMVSKLSGGMCVGPERNTKPNQIAMLARGELNGRPSAFVFGPSHSPRPSTNLLTTESLDDGFGIPATKRG